MFTWVFALIVCPPAVVQSNSNTEFFVIADVWAVPLTLVLAEFLDVKSLCCGDHIVHALMPVVTHPTCDVAPEATVCGFATSVMVGCTT